MTILMKCKKINPFFGVNWFFIFIFHAHKTHHIFQDRFSFSTLSKYLSNKTLWVFISISLKGFHENNYIFLCVVKIVLRKNPKEEEEGKQAFSLYDSLWCYKAIYKDMFFFLLNNLTAIAHFVTFKLAKKIGKKNQGKF